jgi:glycogen debranching enzyme
VDGQVCDFARGGTVDPTLWYPITTLNHYNVVHDRQFLKTHYPKVKRALAWLDCLDQNRDFLLETNEGSDWMDSLLRQGSLYVQALYYGSLRAADEMGAELGVGRTYTTRAERVKENINLLYWPEEKNRGAVEQRLACRQEDFDLVLRAGTLNYYYGEVRLGWYEWRFYSLANVLTVLFDIADGIKKESIFTHISRAKISTPYPLKVTWPPIPAGDKHWAVHFRPKRGFEWICREGNHQNGGIWPFVGGFYVTALKKERRSEAHRELEKLAQACRLGKRGEWEFLEWLNAEGEVVADHPSSFQSWSCATSLLAHMWKPAKSLLRLE